jgi:hypothetical protein
LAQPITTCEKELTLCGQDMMARFSAFGLLVSVKIVHFESDWFAVPAAGQRRPIEQQSEIPDNALTSRLISSRPR